MILSFLVTILPPMTEALYKIEEIVHIRIVRKPNVNVALNMLTKVAPALYQRQINANIILNFLRKPIL